MGCCSMVKKGVLGAALGAGALALLFGTAAPSYVTTAFHKVRANAKASVPIQFEIDRARQEVANLEPAIRQNMETLARAEEDVATLNREIAAFQQNLDREKAEMLALRESLESGEYRQASGLVYSADEIQEYLKNKLDCYEQSEKILDQKVATLKARQKEVAAAQKQLTAMAQAKRTLLTKIAEIEAKLAAIEANKAYNEFHFDDSALARAKQTVSDLEKRLNVMARVAEMEGRFADTGVPVRVEPPRDVLKEIDTKFGPSSNGALRPTAEKSL